MTVSCSSEITSWKPLNLIVVDGGLSLSDSDGASGIVDRCGVKVHDLWCSPDCSCDVAGSVDCLQEIKSTHKFNVDKVDAEVKDDKLEAQACQSQDLLGIGCHSPLQDTQVLQGHGGNQEEKSHHDFCRDHHPDQHQPPTISSTMWSP